MRSGQAPRRGPGPGTWIAVVAAVLVLAGALVTVVRSVRPAARPTVGAPVPTVAAAAPTTARTTTPPAARITLAFAGDVHFAERTATRLAANPAWTAGPTSAGIASAYDDRLVAAVQAARDQAEIVVVYLHWGVEGQGCPSGDQRALAARLAAAGADAVVGTHAHLLLGAGYLGSTYVAYGLGNYLWWRNSAYSDDTGVLRLTFAGRRVVGAVGRAMPHGSAALVQ